MATPQIKKIKAKDALAKVHERNISAFFRQQKAMVIRALSRRSLSSLQNGAVRELMPPEAAWSMTSSEWDVLWQNVMNQTTPTLSKIIASAEADSLHAGATFGETVLDLFVPKGAGKTSFNLANPRAVAWFQENGGSVEYIKGIQKTTGDQIKTIISNALDTGQSYQETAKKIADAFGEMSRDRAIAIATFETGNAYEQGNMLFAQSLADDGIAMVKNWNCEGDSCDDCKANEAESPIPINQYHQSGHQQPQAHLHCVCYETYEQAKGDNQ